MLLHNRVYTAPVPLEKPSDGRLHLKFSPRFVERLRKYADAHGMKLNAVVKKAFELLEDQPEQKEPNDRYGY